MSPALPVPYGVPQGSILGPLLFLLYVNELPDVIKDKRTIIEDEKDEVVVYADDTISSIAANNPELLQRKIQSHAEILPEWFKENDLIVSGEKTKLMFVATSSKRARKITTPGIKIRRDL